MSPYGKREKGCAFAAKTTKYFWIRTVLLIFVVTVAAGVLWQYQSYRTLQAEYADLEQQVADEKQKQLDLQAQKEYYNSDSYIEQIAREKLGLVKSNEIVYINRDQ